MIKIKKCIAILLLIASTQSMMRNEDLLATPGGLDPSTFRQNDDRVLFDAVLKNGKRITVSFKGPNVFFWPAETASNYLEECSAFCVFYGDPKRTYDTNGKIIKDMDFHCTTVTLTHSIPVNKREVLLLKILQMYRDIPNEVPNFPQEHAEHRASQFEDIGNGFTIITEAPSGMHLFWNGTQIIRSLFPFRGKNTKKFPRSSGIASQAFRDIAELL